MNSDTQAEASRQEVEAEKCKRDAASELYEALGSILPILEAVRYTVGLRGNQLDRIARAKAIYAKAGGANG